MDLERNKMCLVRNKGRGGNFLVNGTVYVILCHITSPHVMALNITFLCTIWNLQLCLELKMELIFVQIFKLLIILLFQDRENILVLMQPFYHHLFRRFNPAPLEILCFLCQMGLVTPLSPFPRAFTNVCTNTMYLHVLHKHYIIII